MTKEQVYTQQLRDMGIYQPCFEPLIKELAQAERQRTRAQNAWAATAPVTGYDKKGKPIREKPSFEDPHWEIIRGLNQQILTYRDALGLTPKALRRLRGEPAAQSAGDLISEKLTAIAERVSAYKVDMAAMAAAPKAPEGGGLVPTVDTDE